jgi:hypothetical protein
MRRFSERHGYKPVKTIIQVDGIDQDLRNVLWNALDKHYWWQIERKTSSLERLPPLYNLSIRLSEDYFKSPLDTMPVTTASFRQQVREYFFNSKWFEVYDFIEFVANNYEDSTKNERFVDYCNDILKREVSGYRFIGTTIAPITNESEIAEIEEALQVDETLEPILVHLKSALDYFSDRQTPDYRNSIKESVSAVEAISNLIVGKDKATLGEALKLITTKIELHPALREAFSRLYGYTSDADGIRHALLEESDLDSEDAKFMLVACSAFINYLKVKAAKAGIDL